MTNSRNPKQFAGELLRQDEPLSEAAYLEHRRKLEVALATMERGGKWSYRILLVALAASFVLMFLGGSKAFGSFDPWSKDATLLSAALGMIYCLSIVVFLLAAVAYFWCFRPGVGAAKERLRDSSILDLQRQIAELRARLTPPQATERPGPDAPPADPL